MKIINKIKEMQAYSNEMRKQGLRIGVVPTMGFLHEGHLSLVDEARTRSDIVIVTIFVNPTQFAPNEDLDKYPRDFERDVKLCESRNVGVVFAPSAQEMYPEKLSCWVQEEKLSQGLCGKSRPTHFRGVTTVVTKLFNATLPDVAVFGQKDAQQATILKKMVKDLNFPIEVIIAPIVREDDGLALSSRNKYLSREERIQALAINRALKSAEKMILEGDKLTTKDIISFIENEITSASGVIDYVEIVDAETLEVKQYCEGKLLIAVAAFFGKTRLIDNVIIFLDKN